MILPSPFIKLSRRAGFSLIEMMIAIVILGLGLTMVATMFPVAWDRARQLSEYTTEVAVTAGVSASVESTVRPGGMRDAGAWNAAARTCGPSNGVSRIGTAGLAGDLIFDPNIYYTPGLIAKNLPGAILNDWQTNGEASDTRVHALHLENLLADSTKAPPETANEDPWLLEQVPTKWLGVNYPVGLPRQLACGFEESSFLTPRFPVNMRVYPPLDAPPDAAQLDPMSKQRRKKWLERMERRRFAWAVLHRLREYVGPSQDHFDILANVAPADADSANEDLAAMAAAGWGSPRVFDMYYVTLRRPNATNRYALQDPTAAPDPYNLTTIPTQIGALPLEKDVLFPVAWRVQIELPKSDELNSRSDQTGMREPTGIPTSVRVPPKDAPEAMVDMMIGMFPKATRFVDEINGRVYRVVSTELSSDGGQAILTLDREIVLEDIDLPELSSGGSPECPGCSALDPLNPQADKEELLRTVWVYPPPVDRAQSPSATDVVFKGRTPVSAIDVRTVTLTPAP